MDRKSQTKARRRVTRQERLAALAEREGVQEWAEQGPPFWGRGCTCGLCDECLFANRYDTRLGEYEWWESPLVF